MTSRSIEGNINVDLYYLSLGWWNFYNFTLCINMKMVICQIEILNEINFLNFRLDIATI